MITLAPVAELAAELAAAQPATSAECARMAERARAALRALNCAATSERLAARHRGETWAPSGDHVAMSERLRAERLRLARLARRLERHERASGGVS